MQRFDSDELRELNDFRERVLYLYEKTWRDSRRKFCDTCNVGRTTFYRIWKGEKTEFSDFLIDKYARVFNVSFEFMKYGGDDAGYYYDKNAVSRVCEGGPVYGRISTKKKKKTLALGNANVILTANDPEEILEVLLRIRYQDIDF